MTSLRPSSSAPAGRASARLAATARTAHPFSATSGAGGDGESALPFASDFRPRLRPVEAHWLDDQQPRRLRLSDPMHLSDKLALVPAPLVPFLALMDGTWTVAELANCFAQQTGVELPLPLAESFVAALDEALLLESPRFAAALQAAQAVYRAAPYRRPALAGLSYPEAPDDLDALFSEYATVAQQSASPSAPASGVTPTLSQVPPMGPIGQRPEDQRSAHHRQVTDRQVTHRPASRAAGVLSPHIDYHRGGPVYAVTWQPTLEAVASAEVVVIFGTDHRGSAGQWTPTPQPYATPWGVLPAEREVINAVGDSLGDAAYDEELHHRQEHSIELAVTWLHWALRRAGVPEERLPAVVPILCGSFHPYTHTDERPDTGEAALDALVQSLGPRRVLVVSAADLAHVGPAFGDPQGLTAVQKADLALADSRLLSTLVAGSAAAFLANLRQEQDQRRVCGLPPTYWALRLLERLNGRPSAGRITGYAQCPADADFGSVVSIAGVLWE